MKSRSFFCIFLSFVFLVASCNNAGQNSSAENTEGGNLPVNSTEPASEVSPEPEKITLKMNSSALTSYAPIFIADEEGFFEEQGITMEYFTFNRTQDAIPLILTGDLDVYAGSINAGLLNILGQEETIKVVADRGSLSPSDVCVNQGIIVRKDLYENGEITGPADLKGRTIAASNAGPSGYLLSLYLAQAGLTFDDVTISDVPNAGYMDAMANGTVDAIVAPEPRLSQVLGDGSAILLIGGADVFGSLQSSVVVFGKNLLIDNREAGIRFLTAYLQGIQQYQQGKTDRNVEILVKYSGETEQVIRNSCWINIRTDGRIKFDETVTGFQQWSIDQGQLDNPVTEEQFWDPSLLEDALARMGQ